MNALRRCVVRVVAEARSSMIRRSASELISLTPSLSHHSASGLPSTPCTHEPPRSTGAPTRSSVQVRPPMRSRASSTRDVESRIVQQPRRDQPRHAGAEHDHAFGLRRRPSTTSRWRHFSTSPGSLLHVVEQERARRHHRVAIGVRRADIAQHAHAGRLGRLHARHEVLDDDAVERLLVHRDRGVQEKIGKRLAARHLAGAEDAALEARQQAGDAERHVHLVEAARTRDAGRDARRLERIDRLVDAGHRLQRRVAKGLQRVGLQLVHEVLGQLRGPARPR